MIENLPTTSPRSALPDHESSTGARPAGINDEATAAHTVQEMFDNIAPRYDFLNHLLSAGFDRWWWRRAARVFQVTLNNTHSTVVDLCCGTGDMTMALLNHRPADRAAAPILAVDFSHQMLSRGAQKFAGSNVISIEADALHLPLANSSVDLVTSAFGFRNLANYENGLAEIHRVLRQGGEIGILDCNHPDGVVGWVYSLYFERILPFLGRFLSGDSAAYSYLPASVARFPRPPRMLKLIAAGRLSRRTMDRLHLWRSRSLPGNKALTPRRRVVKCNTEQPIP